uniref:Peptidase S1 domain-containing protein n=1 Tax=Ditylenchus dipsaci TaxID=166011 RepID=A0A915DK26_9BILA
MKHHHILDIALLELAEPLIFNKTIQPICLPKSFSEIYHSVAFVAGWGHDYDETPPETAQDNWVNIDTLKECLDLSQHIHNYNSTYRICSDASTGELSMEIAKLVTLSPIKRPLKYYSRNPSIIAPFLEPVNNDTQLPNATPDKIIKSLAKKKMKESLKKVMSLTAHQAAVEDHLAVGSFTQNMVRAKRCSSFSQPNERLNHQNECLQCNVQAEVSAEELDRQMRITLQDLLAPKPHLERPVAPQISLSLANSNFVRSQPTRLLSSLSQKECQSNCQWSNISEGDYPWLVSMIVKVGAGMWSRACGGSVVSKRHILTARHCLPESQEDLVSFRIVAGKVTVYGTPEVEQNIALEISKTFGASQAIDLQQNNSTNIWMGSDVNETPPETAQDNWVPIDTLKECENYSHLPNFNSTYRICADGFNRGVEHGDSGGPLMVEKQGRWWQIGAVSEGNSGVPSVPQDRWDVYARVSTGCDWMSQVTNNEVKCIDFTLQVRHSPNFCAGLGSRLRVGGAAEADIRYSSVEVG